MVAPLNRPGGLRGPAGGTLDQVIARLDDILAELQSISGRLTDNSGQLATVVDALGDPFATDCAVSIADILCGISTAISGEPAPPPDIPAFRCGNLYQGGYLQTSGWQQMSDTPGFGGGASQAYRALWNSAGPDVQSTVSTVSLPETGNDTPLVRSLNPARATVCLSAVVDGSVAQFAVRRYSWPGLAYIDDLVIGSPTTDTVWTAGAPFNVDTAYAYQFFLALADGFTEPGPAVTFWFTEGAIA